jgi:dipicolinate synthase subunit A
VNGEAKQVPWCILGGDRRDARFARAMLDLGYDVKVSCVPGTDDLPPEVVVHDPDMAVCGASVVVCPVTGTDESGILRQSTAPVDLLQVLSKAEGIQILVIGTARRAVKESADAKQIRVVESMRDDELAILNSVPSAEGAVQIAMQHTDFTIHGSKSAVLGFGRTGVTLASTLQALKSTVTVAARKPQDLARARALGHTPLRFCDLKSALPSFDLVFNTAPALVLPRELLNGVKNTCVIIDLASPPGGVDFEAAREAGITAILAPGLPGLVAPRTAGEILSIVIPRLVSEALESSQ